MPSTSAHTLERRPPTQIAVAAAPADRPALKAHLTAQGLPEGAQLEFTARPGTLLGGPFTSHPWPGLRAVWEVDLGPAHLAYLRDMYRSNPAVRLLLDQMAGQYAYGRNRMVVVADTLAAAGNVIRAVEGLAGRLPPLDID